MQHAERTLDSAEAQIASLEHQLSEHNVADCPRQSASSVQTALRDIASSVNSVLADTSADHARGHSLLERLKLLSLAQQTHCPVGELERRLSLQPANSAGVSLAEAARSLSLGHTTATARPVTGDAKDVILRQQSLDETLSSMEEQASAVDIVRQQSVEGSTLLPELVADLADTGSDDGAMSIASSAGTAAAAAAAADNSVVMDTAETDAAAAAADCDDTTATTTAEQPYQADTSSADADAELDTDDMAAADCDAVEEQQQQVTVCYSWGRGDLGALLHSDTEDHTAVRARVDWGKRRHVVQQYGISIAAATALSVVLWHCRIALWVDTQAFLVLHYIAMRLLDQQISCGTYHTAAVTATGELLACGANDEGQRGLVSVSASSAVKWSYAVTESAVLPGGGYSSDNTADGDASNIILRPMLVDALHSMRITQCRACGHVTYCWCCMLSRHTHARLQSWYMFSRNVPASTAAVYAQQLQRLRFTACTQCYSVVSCGLYHTVCLTATGVVVTFGGNEAGQCGHSPDKHTKALPMAMTGLAARAPRGCVQVAAGDMFTLCLTAQQCKSARTTSTIAVLHYCYRITAAATTISSIGSGSNVDRHTVEPIIGMAALPIRSVHAPHRNSALAVTALGAAYSWGLNSHGQRSCHMIHRFAALDVHPYGIKKRLMLPFSNSRTAHSPDIGVKDALVLSPTLMPGTGPVSGTSTSTGLGVSAQATSARMVLSAACGAQHTVLVTHSGGVLVQCAFEIGMYATHHVMVGGCAERRCASHGQLGHNPEQVQQINQLTTLQLDAEAHIVQAACGMDHTLLRTSDGKVLSAGSNSSHQLGLDTASIANTISSGTGDSGSISDDAASRSKKARLTSPVHSTRSSSRSPTAAAPAAAGATADVSESADSGTTDTTDNTTSVEELTEINTVSDAMETASDSAATATADTASLSSAATTPTAADANDMLTDDTVTTTIAADSNTGALQHSMSVDADSASSDQQQQQQQQQPQQQEDSTAEPQSSWQFTAVTALELPVAFIAAGGEQSFAIAAPNSTVTSSSSSSSSTSQQQQQQQQQQLIVGGGALQREFSVPTVPWGTQTLDSFTALIRGAESHLLYVMASCRQQHYHSKIAVPFLQAEAAGSRKAVLKVVRETFAQPSLLNASFLGTGGVATAQQLPDVDRLLPSSSTLKLIRRISVMHAGHKRCEHNCRHAKHIADVHERMQTALLALGADVCTAYSEAMKQGLTALESTHKAEHMSQPESVRCLLVYWLSPLHERPGFGRAPPQLQLSRCLYEDCDSTHPGYSHTV
eukprot:19643-Heterococcus_DN1.PRE.3